MTYRLPSAYFVDSRERGHDEAARFSRDDPDNDPIPAPETYEIVPCMACHGTGQDSLFSLDPCPRCDGRGEA